MTVDSFTQMEIIETYRPCSVDGWHGSTVCFIKQHDYCECTELFLITTYYFITVVKHVESFFFAF